MKRFIIFSLMLAMANLTTNAKVAVLPDLMKPQSIIVDNDQIFVVEDIHIFIYSLKDFKLKKRIGNAGEGPKEFKKNSDPILSSIQVHLLPDGIFVSSTGKISFFTREGTFIKENRTTSPLGRFVPLGKKYVALGFATEENSTYVTFNMYENPVKKEKEILRFPFPLQPGKKINPMILVFIEEAFTFYNDNGKLFCLTQHDGVVHIFDENGKEIQTIAGNYPKVKLTVELKDQYDRFFSEDIRFKNGYKAIKSRNMLEFPEYLPLVRAYRVSDGKVYMITFNQKNEKFETFIFNVQGKLLKKSFLPLLKPNIMEIYPFTMFKDKIYQLVENEEEEEWQLRITGIK
jgi:hypothetical protein